MYQKLLLAASIPAAPAGFDDWKYMEPTFFLFAIPVVFLYGICIGSFLNVVIIRLPIGESLTKRASHCMTCGTKIRIIDLIPVFSWLFLKGKCHSCGEKISPRYPIVETLNGLLYVADFLIFGLTANMFIMCIFTSVLVVVGFMDWDTQEMDMRVLLVIVLLVIPSYFASELTIADRLIGAASIGLPFFLIGELTRPYAKKKTGEDVRGVELGDTILMAFSGLLLGWKAMVPSAFIGILFAGVFGSILKKKTGESKFAFGPYLCMGLYLGAMFGPMITEWYISRFPQPETYEYYANCILMR